MNKLRYISCCLLFYITNSYSENNYPLEDPSELTTDLATYSGTCDDLKPITSFKDFFLQLYHHLDDDCLYTMSNKTLAEKLGVSVLNSRYWEKNQRIFDNSRSESINDAIFVFRQEPKIKKETVHIKMAVQKEEEILGIEPYREKIRKQGYEFHNGGFSIAISNHYLGKFGNPFINDFPENLPPTYQTNDVIRYDSSGCNARSRVKKLHPNYLEQNYWKGFSPSSIMVTSCRRKERLSIEMSIFKQLFTREEKQ